LVDRGWAFAPPVSGDEPPYLRELDIELASNRSVQQICDYQGDWAIAINKAPQHPGAKTSRLNRIAVCGQARINLVNKLFNKPSMVP